MPLSSAVFTMPRAIGCSDSDFDTGRDAKRLVLRQPLRDGHGHDPELAERQRSRLVEDHGVEIPGLLKSAPVPHQKTVAGPSVVEMATTSGTASPSACGQAITSTVTIRTTEKSIAAPIIATPRW